MDAGLIGSAIWAAAVIALVVLVLLNRRARGRGRGHRRRTGIGTGAAGTVYDWLNQDKQKAIDIIVEGQAEARRPEYPDGNLPDLEKPKEGT